jgi:hypothetical protein
MLKQMCEALLAGPFILRADVIPQIHAHHWASPHWAQNHIKPIAQRSFGGFPAWHLRKIHLDGSFRIQCSFG